MKHTPKFLELMEVHEGSGEIQNEGENPTIWVNAENYQTMIDDARKFMNSYYAMREALEHHHNNMIEMNKYNLVKYGADLRELTEKALEQSKGE